MSGLRNTGFILLLAGVWLSSAVFARANDEWKQTDSANFHVVSNASGADTERIVGQFEAFRQSFFSLFQEPEAKSPIPTRILIFKSPADFANYLKSQTGSSKKNLPENVFQPGTDTNYIVVTPDAAKTDFRLIYHQYFHYLLSNHVGRSKIPAWLDEGLAQAYENYQANGDSKGVFSTSENRDEPLRHSKLLPAEAFFNTDYYTLDQQEKHGAGVFYAQSAALVEYLSAQNGGENFARFIKLLLSGASPNEALAKVFQLDAQTAESVLKGFVENKPPTNVFGANSKSVKTPDLTFSPLSPPETESYLGDYLYQSNRPDEAELHLLKSLALNPLASFPRSTLGLVKLRQYKTAEAFEHLDKALDYGNADYLAYYRYAYALSRQGMTEYGFVSNYDAETAERMRGFLSKSSELNPDFAENYNLYALIGFVRNEELDKSLDLIRKALAGSPGNEQLLLRRAELEMRKETFTPARKIALEVYRNAANSGVRLYAQNTIQRIDSTEYQLLESRRNDKLPYSDAISEKPFSDEEIARLRAKAMRESLTAALRQPAPDEKRIFGHIIEIGCQPDRVDFTVRTNERIIKLYAESFELLKLMTFNSTIAKSQIGCGASNVENAVIIYKILPPSKNGISGEIVSIEFVPKEFTLSVNY